MQLKLSLVSISLIVSFIGGVVAVPQRETITQSQTTRISDPTPPPPPSSVRVTTEAPRTTAPTSSVIRSTVNPPPTTSRAQPTTAPPPPSTTGTSPPQPTHTGSASYALFGLGSCGFTSSDSELVVAVSKIFMDKWPGATANPNKNPLCRRKLTARYQNKTVTATVVDTCRGCAEYGLLFSPTAFRALANIDLGSIRPVVWNIV